MKSDVRKNMTSSSQQTAMHGERAKRIWNNKNNGLSFKAEKAYFDEQKYTTMMKTVYETQSIAKYESLDTGPTVKVSRIAVGHTFCWQTS